MVRSEVWKKARQGIRTTSSSSAHGYSHHALGRWSYPIPRRGDGLCPKATPASWKPSILTPHPALHLLHPLALAHGTSGLQPVVVATPSAIQPHIHPKAPPPPRAGLPSDLSLMSVLCHQTLKFLKAEVGFPLSFTRPGTPLGLRKCL